MAVPATPVVAQDESTSSQPQQLPPSATDAEGDAAMEEITGRIMPGTPRAPTGAGANKCMVNECALPGGHAGPHKDGRGKTFSWTSADGRVDLEGGQSDSDTSSSSSSSASSEELQPDEPMRDPAARKRKEPEEGGFYALEIEVPEEAAAYLREHPRKAAIWLSKKMQEKGKEHFWQHLPLSKKKEFDIAQAKELSNVRGLTKQEELALDPRTCMHMRWVLTTKSDGSSKARLVILGFQQPNVAEIQSAAPTMSRMSRNMLLMTCANMGFRMRAADVTSAFLQTSENIESEGLTVWATPELAVLYGASPSNPCLPMRVSRAFYGLVHAPKKWYDDVAKTLLSFGWKRMLSDGCLFTLWDGDQLVAIAGLHVDDFLIGGHEFLIGGHEDNALFKSAMEKLEKAYRWGKWQHSDFVFAGCHICQDPDGTIRIDQNAYSDQWLDEVELSPERARDLKAPATPAEITHLRGVIGSMAWRTSQTSPHFQADVGLILSEVPYATVATLIKVNKLVRELKRTPQSLTFPQGGMFHGMISQWWFGLMHQLQSPRPFLNDGHSGRMCSQKHPLW